MEISNTREKMILGLLISDFLHLVRAFYNKSIKWDWLESVKLSSISFIQMISWCWTLKNNLPFNTLIIPSLTSMLFFLCVVLLTFSSPSPIILSTATLRSTSPSLRQCLSTSPPPGCLFSLTCTSLSAPSQQASGSASRTSTMSVFLVRAVLCNQSFFLFWQQSWSSSQL